MFNNLYLSYVGKTERMSLVVGKINHTLAQQGLIATNVIEENLPDICKTVADALGIGFVQYNNNCVFHDKEISRKDAIEQSKL